MRLGELIDGAGTVMEVAGTATMIVGAAGAAVAAAAALVRRTPPRDAFRSLRQNLGRAILLGLEFLVAADIIRTVSTVPTLLQVAVLGAIVLIRTFLSFTLEVELEGRWPWARSRTGREGPRPGRARPAADERRGGAPPDAPPARAH